MKNELIGFDFEKMQPIGFDLLDVTDVESHIVSTDGYQVLCVIVIVIDDTDVLMSVPDTDVELQMELAQKIADKVSELRTMLN